MSTMTREQAQSLRAARDTDAKLLSRKPKYELMAILRSETGAEGTYSKDEAIASILAARGFGIAKLNEAIHVLGHDVTWPDCEWCQNAEADRILAGKAGEIFGIPFGPRQ